MLVPQEAERQGVMSESINKHDNDNQSSHALYCDVNMQAGAVSAKGQTEVVGV